MKKKIKEPKVGIGIFIWTYKNTWNNWKFLMGKRKNSLGAGEWGLPGGHLEFMESWNDCAIREVKEETNIDIKDRKIEFLTATNDIFKKEDKHYITIFLQTTILSPIELILMEPNKCEEWKWFGSHEVLDDPNINCFIPVKEILKKGYRV